MMRLMIHDPNGQHRFLYKDGLQSQLSPNCLVGICENGIVMLYEALNNLNGTKIHWSPIIQGNHG